MFRTEESKVSAIILLTFALLLVAGIYPAYVLYATIISVAVIILLTIYARLTKARAEPQDERSTLCSLRATRNGFMVAIALIALLAVAASLGAPFSIIQVLQMVWGLGVAAYFLSYLYYKRVV